MGRRVRLYKEGVAQYIYISGIDNVPLFKDERDYLFYKKLLQELSISFHVSLHAYSLLKNSIHFLCTFSSKDTLSRFMQSLSLKYVSYYNRKYKREGTLWKSRYKSSLIEDKYILAVMIFIESLRENEFSSYKKNYLAQKDDILFEHEMYKLLGKNEKDRAYIYSNKFKNLFNDKNIFKFIKSAIQRQDVIGDNKFKKILEKELSINLSPKKRGRPKNRNNNKKGEKMYSNLVVLDKEKHKGLKVSPLENLEFAKDMPFVPILVSEAPMVSEMFPVVFTTDESPDLVCLTSLGGKNLAINEEGKYIARYVPAFLRKYPFSLAPTQDDPEKKVILIDENAKNVSKTKGKQLFTKDGEQSEILKNAIKFLTDYEQQHQTTLAIAKALKDADILEEREITVGEGEEKKVLVKGFQVVNRKKLNELDDEVLAQWVRNGIISFIDSHLKSLERIDTLFKIESQIQQ